MDLSSHTLIGVLSRIQQGERGSDPDLARLLNQAFGKHERPLRFHCRGELHGFPESAIDEMVQDVFLEAWLKLPGYQPRKEFRVFLWQIARLKCANARRKRRDVLSEDGFLEAGSDERSAIANLADEERNTLIDQAAKNVLDKEDQDLVHMRWVLDHPLDVLAPLFELPDANAVRVRLQRCKRRMRTEIHRLLDERGLGKSFLREPE